MIGLADGDQLGGWLGEPLEQVADLLHADALRASVAIRGRGVLGDEHLVADVDVRRVALLGERSDCLVGDFDRHWLVEQETA